MTLWCRRLGLGNRSRALLGVDLPCRCPWYSIASIEENIARSCSISHFTRIDVFSIICRYEMEYRFNAQFTLPSTEGS